MAQAREIPAADYALTQANLGAIAQKTARAADEARTCPEAPTPAVGEREVFHRNAAVRIKVFEMPSSNPATSSTVKPSSAIR